MCLTPIINVLEVFKVETMLPVGEKVFANLEAMRQEQTTTSLPSAQSTLRSRRSSTSFAAKTRGLHFLDKSVLWREHVITTHKSCLLALVDFVSMLKRQIAMIKDRIRRADRDIPELPWEAEEWKKIGDYFREMEIIGRGRRTIPEESLSLATLINTLHNEAQSRMCQTTSLHMRLQITLSKMGIQQERIDAIHHNY
ncbi:hypothetical protein PRIPAC_70510 [Pristionchus pacificus]|uniref:Uncharacterized protein n=1 Tax=Pristionchus pacificus TaxID=54126 RepID=A0A2A6BZ32_PRIPA|nr:hypothetical protein PRIPAC_70510 [Pristionchus pacificus]|eukprot:PDM71262.1 hypothetical protein PRIPAC_37669 [Pristionchus pacificus]